jgi:eukaryotic-like serine/threonine-protein kinase
MNEQPTGGIPPVDADPDNAPGSTRDPYAPTAGLAGDATEHSAPLAAPSGYELLDEIGSGGMGVVFRARDIALNRHVALKILHTRYAIDGVAARRFNDEAAITGQLQHPGIPPIHQIGTLPDGRPFLAMKLIKGSTLEDLLKERSSPAEDRGRFLAVFEQVCQAVGYAHAHNVIHRDLKPANVMVGSFAEVQVMDWGLAKTLTADRTLDASATEAEETLGTEILSLRGLDSATQAGSILGTPAFMPPEQAGGEIAKIDTRSDVFGLGAILCVILTGKPPYAAKDGETARLMAIRGQLDEGLARLDASGAEPELIALCKRCLSLEPADRPADGGEVAAAVASFRQDAEERARQAELERARAEVATAEQRKRRRWQAVLGTALTAAIVLVGFGLWWQERQSAAIAAARASREARTAAEVSGAVAETRERVAEAWELIGRPERIPAAVDTAEAAFRKAEGFAAAGEPTAETLAELASVRETLADLQRHARFVIDTDESKHQFLNELGGNSSVPAQLAHARRTQEAIRRFGLAPLTAPESETARAIAGSRLRDTLLGALLTWQCHSVNDEALREKLKNVIRSTRRACGGVYARWQDILDRNATDELVVFATTPGALTIGSTLIDALGRDLFRFAQNYEAARAFLRAATDRYPYDIWLHFDAGSVCEQLNPPANHEALRYRAAAAALRPDSKYFQFMLARSYQKIGADEQAIVAFRRAIALEPTHAISHRNLARAQMSKGDLDDAIASYRKAIELDPKDPDAHRNLARALMSKGDLDGAIASYRKAIELDPKDPDAHRNLIVAWKDQGQLKESMEQYLKALEIDPKQAVICVHLGLAIRNLGLLDEAITCFRRASALEPKDAYTHDHLGFVLHKKGNLDEAIECFKQAIALNPKHPNAHKNLVSAWKDRGKLKESIEQYLKGLEIDPKRAIICVYLGNALGAGREWDGAIACYRKAIALDPKYASAHNELSIAQRAKGDLDGAIASHRRAIELDPKNAPYHNNLGRTLRAKGDLDGAITSHRQAIELDAKYAPAHETLGIALRAKGDLDGAIAAYRKAIELDPTKSPIRYTLASLLLSKGDVDGAFAAFDLTDLPYKAETRDIHGRCWIATAALAAWFDQTARYDAVCDRALAFARETTSPQVAERVAKVCSLRSGVKDRQDGALTLVRQAVEQEKGQNYVRLALGMAQYRAGHFNVAVKTLDLGPQTTGFVSVTAGFYRAMSLFKAGEKDQAREVALKAAAAMRPLPKDPKNPLTDSASADDVIVWLAYREAKELIGFPEAAAKKK